MKTFSCAVFLTLSTVAHGLVLGQEQVKKSASPVAVLVSGTVDRLLVTPVLENVVRANSNAGTQVDIFFSLHKPSQEQNYAANKGESKWLVTEGVANRYTKDPKITKVLQAYDGTMDKLFSSLCSWAHAAGATNCYTETESDEALSLTNDTAHRKMMTYYSPIETQTGQNVLRRWRTLESLWEKAKSFEKGKGFSYSQVLIGRDDDYWLAPYIFDSSQFESHPAMIKAISCLEAHGINDKMLHMGRVAADKLMPAYTAWTKAEEPILLATRNAEEFLFKMAMLKGVSVQPQAFSMALATTTVSGIPCFRKQVYNLTTRGGYHQCYGEDDESGPLTKLFKAFNCDEMNPAFFDQLSPAAVASLHGAIEKVAGDARQPFLFTITDASTVDMTRDMLRSFSETREQADSLVVGIEDGVCKSIRADLPRTVCVELATGLPDAGKVKHALLTTAAVSGHADGLLFAEPGVRFLKPPMQVFKSYASNKDVVFAPERAANEPASCKDALESYAGIDTGLFYLQSTPGAAHVLLRAWMHLIEASQAELAGGVSVNERVMSTLTYESKSGSSVKAGDIGVVRGPSTRDPQRVVIDFPSFKNLGLLARQFKKQDAISKAAVESTGLRVGIVPCKALNGQAAWERKDA